MNGILNIKKEQDFTSNDVVAKLRGICHMRKIGHTGTLDPMATGVLPVCLGTATKLCDILADHDKVYETVLLLGKTSDTQDIWGKVLSEKTVECSETDVENVIYEFIGGYDQMPPMYSAKKINGQKLYDLARAGITVERKKTRVIIYDIEIIGIDLPRVRMRVHCGKGTYIRTLCNDIGEKLGCGGLMEYLERQRVGVFDISKSITLKEAEELMKADKLSEFIIPVDAVFADLPSINTGKDSDKLLHNGNPLSATNINLNNKKCRVYDSEGKFCGIYEYDVHKHKLMPVKMFLEN